MHISRGPLLVRKVSSIRSTGRAMPDQHLCDTVRFLLSYQNLGDPGGILLFSNCWVLYLEPYRDTCLFLFKFLGTVIPKKQLNIV